MEQARGVSAAFILAAGRSVRFGSALVKVMHALAGKPLVSYVIDVAKRLVARGGNKAEASKHTILVTSSQIPQATFPEITHAAQETPRGTGDAVAVALNALPEDAKGDALILLGDAPLITEDTILPLLSARAQHPTAAMIVLGMRPPNPAYYGRLKVDEDRLLEIIEESDATAEEKTIGFCNSGIMLVDIAAARRFAKCVYPAPEIRITDWVRLAARASETVIAVEAPWEDLIGINTREGLAAAETIMQRRLRAAAMNAGVTLVAPETVFFSYDTQLARDVIVHPFVRFSPGVVVDSGAEILSFSVLAGVHVHENASVGPFAHIRGDTQIGAGSVVGNFVEIKNSVLGEGVRAKHMSYIGDATLENDVLFGAGVVICNYDGHKKSCTHVGEGSLVGSNTSLIAPLNIGECVTVGAGSVITKDVPSKTLALSRAPQTAMSLPEHSQHLHRKKKTRLEDRKEQEA